MRSNQQLKPNDFLKIVQTIEQSSIRPLDSASFESPTHSPKLFYMICWQASVSSDTHIVCLLCIRRAVNGKATAAVAPNFLYT